MIKILAGITVLLFALLNYNNLVSYYFIINNKFSESLEYSKTDLGYYNTSIDFYKEGNYKDSITYLENIENKTYKIHFNLGNSYFFESKNKTENPDVISSLENAVFNFGEALKVNKDDYIQNNYDIALKELNILTKGNNSKTNSYSENDINEKDTYISDENIEKYNIELGSEIKFNSDKQNIEIEKYIEKITK